MAVKGIIISGKFGEIIARQKAGERIEIGELLVSEDKDEKVIYQVYDLGFGSQISQSNLELVSGMKLEDSTDMEFMDSSLRNYTLAYLKSILTVSKTGSRSSKALPSFFSEIRSLTKDDLSFLTKPRNPVFLGHIRSGSQKVDVDVYLEGDKVFSHHLLIAATTGRGKSNLASNILWDMVGKGFCGMLVLDPHDEYYGRNRLGLKDHPDSRKVKYYTPNSPPPGAATLKVNIKLLKPEHFNGVLPFSDAQKQALVSYSRKYGDDWIEAILLDKPLDVGYNEGTIAVVKRRLMSLLDLEISDSTLYCNGVFDIKSGHTTISDICQSLEKGDIVIVDTSSFSGAIEILVGSLIATEALNRYRRYKRTGELTDKPIISIFLEEAPRVLGKEVLEQGPNVFSTIAREGRKFKVGLTAITQLPSLIPREILANINTKIIMGIEMSNERQAIIDSASQDISADSRNIASLDKGEAIVTSNFTRFALPIKIPLFDEFSKRALKEKASQSHETMVLGLKD